MTTQTESLSVEELHSTFQLAGIVLRVRHDLNVLVREYGGQPTYIIEDELTSAYYRIGQAEYTFLSLLDGRNTFATALGRTAALMKEDGLTEDRAASFCKWLVQSGLASTAQSRSVARLGKQSEEGEQHRARGKFSILSQRIPLFHPQASVDLLHRMVGWMFTGPVFLLWMILVAVGGATVVLQWERFTAAASSVVAQENWIWLIATWLLLKFIHESAHAAACRRFGGSVREVGILFIVMLPLPYVDVSSAWRFASKWQRIITSAAGMMAELTIAAVAAIVWSQTGPGLLHQHAYNVIVSAGLMTLLFNLNPLMRFDGYYILTDFLELPNLYTHGQHALMQLGRRWGLGLTAQKADYPEGRSRAVLCYGIAAFCWRILICVGLVLAANTLFYGAGTLLAITAAALWVLVPVVRLLRFVAVGNRFEQPSRGRFVMLTTCIAMLCCAIVTLVPWYSSATAPLVIDYASRVQVRAAASGFVDEVMVETGQVVRAGDVLFVLRNEELQASFLQIELDIRTSERRAAGFLQRQETAALQIENETMAALRKRSRELSRQHESLQVKASSDGIVLTPRIDDMRGAYVTSGTLLLTLGAESDRMVMALVNQSQSDAFRSQVGGEVNIHIAGATEMWQKATLLEVSERATRNIPHPALAAHAGGPISVRVARRSSDRSDNKVSGNYELQEPHFIARTKLPPETTASALAGQTGNVTFFTQDGSTGHHLRRVLDGWWAKHQTALARQLYLR